MAMILDAFMSKCCTLLTDYVQEEVTTLLGVKEELKKLLQRMRSIQSLLKDAEKRKFDESSIDLWLSELKDVMYDADDVIDLCRIEGTQLPGGIIRLHNLRHLDLMNTPISFIPKGIGKNSCRRREIAAKIHCRRGEP